MQRLERNRVNSFIASVLLVIISLYYSSSTMFGHTHIINGATITHSHFHGANHAKTPDGNHTPDELTLISYITQGVMSSGEVLSFEVEVPTQHTCYENAVNMLWDEDEVTLWRSPRAPPVLMLS